MDPRKIFFVALVITASGFVSPPVALALGLVYAFSFQHPYLAETHSLSKFLLQASVVALGFGMNLGEVVRVGVSGFRYTAISIVTALVLGLMLGRGLRVKRVPSFLISAGTAICGGSAIAAVGPLSNASDEEMAVSLGTIFVLNSIALMAFPLIGWAIHLSQSQFGLWSALAIQDTSSVIGATAKYGSEALAIGTTVKLARALWIVPLSLGLAIARRSSAKIQWPWFILLFCVAATVSSLLPGYAPISHRLGQLGTQGLTVTLFLIGTGISRNSLKSIGSRPLIQGALLWIAVAGGSLLFICRRWIAL
ncbi:MAG TPA: putative sulfate exporter family transporter [Bryobacteraceae bacterium]|nr:putative sulfate exporter family transporter [Bryobacteraceae bacterium]